jgi:phage terminase Nu1 subunit (DNA packaging protein)
VTERYVTARQLAELMGVSERTIKRMVAAGMPSETWGMTRCRRFLPSQAMAWASAREPGTIELVNPPATVRQHRVGPEPHEVP